MTTTFNRIPLADLLKQSNVSATIDPEKSYRQVTVKLWGKGVELRSEVEGINILDAKLFVARENQFILSKIDARNGAFGLIPSRLDGAVVSQDFPVFEVNTTKLLPDYLNWISKTADFVQLCAATSEGTTNRVRLKIDRFLASAIPLPSLEEQRRIVGRIEEFAAKIEEARGLRREAVEETNLLLSTAISQSLARIKHQARDVTLASVAVSVTDGDHQPPPKSESGIPFIFINHIADGELDFTDCRWVSEEYYSSLPANRVPKRGDVLYTAVGSYGIPCLVDTDDAFCFQRHIAIIKPDRNQVGSEYLKWALSSSEVYNQATHFTTGSAQLTIPLRGIRQLTFPLPSLEQQNQLATFFNMLKTRQNVLKEQQSAVTAELDALLPSILDRAFKGEL